MESIQQSLKALEFETVIAKRIISTLVDKGIKTISKLFDNSSDDIIQQAKHKLKKEDYEFFQDNYDLEISESKVLNSISHNLKKTNKWSHEVDFRTAISSKTLNQVFVELDLYLSLRKDRFDQDEQIDKIPSTSLLQKNERNIIVYGGPGAGKTTLLKRICREYIENPGQQEFIIPIVIRFREIDYDQQRYGQYFGLFNILTDTLGIDIKFPIKHIQALKKEYYQILKRTIVTFLDDCKILFIADGFDEIPSQAIKTRIQREFEELALSLEKSTFILTSRISDFELKLTDTQIFEICPLNEYQIKSIINKWLEKKSHAEDLYSKIKQSPYFDTTLRPLTLSHLCAIYERRKNIPPKPRYIYDFVLNLLLELWDQQRSINRPSSYADFYIEKKKEFLAHLSFWFSYHLKKNVFDSDDIRKSYKKIHLAHALPPSQAKKVVAELESHTGLFIQVGYNSFQFSHKSIQEFLTARYIYSLPKIPDHQVLSQLPEETAIAVSLSSSPNLYFESFLQYLKSYETHFWPIFIDRLIEEQPDFDENPAVLVFLLVAIEKGLGLIFLPRFQTLFKHTNLKITIKPFFKVYKVDQTFVKNVSLIHKRLDISLPKRAYFPSKILVRNDIFDMIS